MMSSTLYPNFLKITKHLNTSLGIVPVLYGSLGLSRILNQDLESRDIDVLVPKKYVTSEWQKLIDILSELGYKMVNEHEHEFIRDDIKIGIAHEEDLEPFAQVDYKNLETVADDGARYKVLSLEDYKKVYSKSKLDSYRANKKNKQDSEKLELIEKYQNKN